MPLQRWIGTVAAVAVALALTHALRGLLLHDAQPQVDYVAHSSQASTIDR
jgi:hypothetical protein